MTKLVIGLDYESHDWAAEATRRAQQAASSGPRIARGRQSTTDIVIS